MNHKILSKHDVVITFPFSSNAINAFKITKNICTKLQAMYPNIYKAELMCSFKCNRNTYENLNLRALKNLNLCKNIRTFLDVLKSELCSFFVLQLLLIVHVTMVTKPYFCHHYWQMITRDILWACCEKSISSLSTYWVIQISHNWTDVLFSIPDKTPALLIVLLILLIGKRSDKSAYIIPLSCYWLSV